MKKTAKTTIAALGMIIAALGIIFFGARNVMAIEEAPYKVVDKDGKFEVRDYAPQILAETTVEGTLEDAGNKAFDTLFRYISGNNRSKAKVAMTPPVGQQPATEKIPMTAPVGQQRAQGNKWVISFMMPTSYTLQTLPEPTDSKVTLRQLPARRIAVVRYSGTWSEKRFLYFRTSLEKWMQKKDLKAAGEPIWARYNPPFTPWFLRRNEILIPIAKQ